MVVPDLAALADVAVFLGGAALLAGLVRWWRPQVSRRAVLGCVAATLLFWGGALATPALQVASDIPYLWRPWSETVARGFAPANPLLSDVPLQFVPFHTLVRQRLLRLQAPLWAHELGTGQPLLGNGQSAAFAPLHLLALALPAPRALTVSVAWQTLVALLLMVALLLRLRAGGAGAALGALAFAFSTYQVAWAYHPHAMAAAWLPGVLLGLLLVAEGERGGRAGLVVCGLAMALSGHAETLAQAAVLSGAVAAVLVARRPSVGRARLLAWLSVAALLVAALSAPVLLPLAEALPHGERFALVERAPRAVEPPPFAARHLLPVVEPLAFGSPRDGNWRGPANFNEMSSSYAGLAALALAVAGALVLRGRVLWILLGGALALAGAVGLPPFLDLWRALPLLEHAAHARLRLFWVLAVAVAAGLSAPELARRRRGALIAAALAGVAVAAAAAAPPPGGAWQTAWLWAAAAGCAAVAAALALPRLRPWAPAAAVAAVALDLWLLGVRYHPLVMPARDLSAPPALAAIAGMAAADAAAGLPGRVLAAGYDLHPNLAALAGLWDPRPYDPMHPARASDLLSRRLDSRHRPGRWPSVDEDRLDQPLFDYLGVRSILTRHRARLPPPWRSGRDAQGGRVWRNPEALGLFFMPAHIDRVPSQGEAVAHAVANRDFRRSAVLVDPSGTRGGADQAGRVEGARPRSNGWDLDVETTAGGGVLASSVSYLPGWRAADARGELAIVEVNSGFLGVVVRPGKSAVRLDYRPAGWRWGLAACAAAAVGLAVAGLRRRRGFVLALLLAATGCAPRPPAAERTIYRLADALPAAEVHRETSEIDLGTPAARAHLVEGWHRNETDRATGTTLVWSRGDSSLLEFFLSTPRRLRAELRCAPHPQLAAGLWMEVELNGRRLAGLRLAPGTVMRSYVVDLPLPALAAGVNRLRFLYHLPAGERTPGRRAVVWDRLRLAGLPARRPVEPRVSAAEEIYLPFGTEVAFALEAPASAELRLAELLPLGGSGALVVETRGEAGAPESGRAVLRPGGRCCRPVALAPGAVAGPRLLRLALRAVPDDPAAAGGLRLRRARVAARVATAAALPAEPASAPAAAPPPNVIVYLVDTLRADRLGCYGHRGSLTPRADDFARGATLYERAVAQAPWTRPAVASLFTGLEPLDHGVWNLETKLAESARTLAEMLAGAGYRTAAVSTNHHVTGVFGLSQGFADFSFLARDPDSESANRWAVDWLDRAGARSSPFFLYVHTIDPHQPYAPAPAYRRRFAPQVPAGTSGDDAGLARARASTGSERARLMGELALLYDAEVAHNDASFGAFLDELRRRGLYDDALVVFLADHGEEFDEHGALGHAQNLYAQTLDVPLIVKYPRQTAGRRVAALVQQVDFLPTVLRVAGLEPPAGLPGRDLRALEAEGARPSWPPRAVFSHLAHNAQALAVIRGGWKLILPLGAARREAELYRWRRSGGPSERRDQAAARPLRVAQLSLLIRLEILRHRPPRQAQPAEVDAETRAALRALGYM